MKYISRLTALLTALMLLLSSAAMADTAVSYDEWLAAQQAAKGAYCTDENCTYLYTALHMEDVTEQYEYLNSLANVTITDENGVTYTRLHMVLSHYGFAWGEVITGTDTAHPFDGTELCTCFADDTTLENYVLYPYGDAKHSDTCAWSGAAIDGESLLAEMLALETVEERQAYSNELYPAEIAAMLAAYRETDTVTQWLADLQEEDTAATIKDAALLYALLAGGEAFFPWATTAEGVNKWLTTSITNWQGTDTVELTMEMVLRAYEVGALAMFRLEGNALISVRTGETIATYDEATGALTDTFMGIIIGYIVDGVVTPIETAE